MAITVRRVVSLFLSWADQSLKKSTHDAYAYQLEKFVAHVKRKTVPKLTPLDLTTWAKSWHEFQAASRCLSWAANEAKIIKKSPFAGIKPPPRKERNRTLSPQELCRLLRACRPAPRLFFLAMLQTYARPQEIRALKWSEIKTEIPGEPLRDALWNGRAIGVMKEFKDRRRRKENTRPRVILISQRLGRSMCRLLDRGASPTGEIFRNSDGNPWSKDAVRCVMRRLRRKLGMVSDEDGEKLVAYTLRHTAATHASAHGVLDRALADILGHVETRTTARYQHLNIGHLRAAISRVMEQKRSQRKPTRMRKSAKR